MEYNFSKAELKQKNIKNFQDGDIILCDSYKLLISTIDNKKTAKLFMKGNNIPKFIKDFRGDVDESGFIPITLSAVKSSIGYREYELYYCANKQKPSDDQSVNTVLFSNLAYFERWCGRKREQICNATNGTVLKFFYKKES